MSNYYYHLAVVKLVRLWPAGLGLRPAPLALLVVGVRVALVAVALVEIPLLVKDAATCVRSFPSVFFVGCWLVESTLREYLLFFFFTTVLCVDILKTKSGKRCILMYSVCSLCTMWYCTARFGVMYILLYNETAEQSGVTQEGGVNTAGDVFFVFFLLPATFLLLARFSPNTSAGCRTGVPE